MKFFNIRVEIENNPFQKEGIGHREECELAVQVCKSTMDLMEETCVNEGCIFLSETDKPCLTVCTYGEEVDEMKLVDAWMQRCGYANRVQSCKEVSIDVFFGDVRNANRKDLVRDDDEVIDDLDLSALYHCRRTVFDDRIVEEEKSAETLREEAKENYLGCRYQKELNRILNGEKAERFLGVPAHYILGSTDAGHRRTMIRNLVSALYRQGRLRSRRYTIVSLGEGRSALSVLPQIYQVNDGATVLLKIERDDVNDGGDGFRCNDLDIGAICEIVKANCARVLTVFSIVSRSERVKEKIKNELMGLAVVDVSEDLYEKEDAVAMMEDFARKDGAELPQNMKEKILHSDRGYDFNALSSMYGKWRHEYLSTTAFPEYKTFLTHEVEEEEKKSNAYLELQNMIGLKPVKKIIDEAIGYFKLQKEYRRRGIEFHRPAMHMVFTGSPGTAKTSVARLVARIFKDNDILSVGNLVEVGRGDIIGEYVGHTAPLVKSVFKKAQGSVLFIDEAYSLVDDKRGLYGDEAINTIVQEMENHRDDLIVIFAGYQAEMKTFLDRNPGLNSRIAFHVPFEDYSNVELLDITKLLAEKSGFSVEAGAEEKLLNIFDSAKRDSTFGNGRFARNLFEKAKMALSNRIAKKDLQFLSDNELTTLTADDFQFGDATPKVSSKIGFSA